MHKEILGNLICNQGRDNYISNQVASLATHYAIFYEKQGIAEEWIFSITVKGITNCRWLEGMFRGITKKLNADTMPGTLFPGIYLPKRLHVVI